MLVSCEVGLRIGKSRVLPAGYLVELAIMCRIAVAQCAAVLYG